MKTSIGESPTVPDAVQVEERAVPTGPRYKEKRRGRGTVGGGKRAYDGDEYGKKKKTNKQTVKFWQVHKLLLIVQGISESWSFTQSV